MLNKEDIFKGLKEILLTISVQNMEALNNASYDSSLVDDLGLTSVGLLYLVIVIEEKFNMRFVNKGISDFQTVGDVVTYIYENQGK